MSHQEKQRIFDEYAKSQGFKDWEDVQTEYHLALMSDDELKLYIFSACDLVQEQQQKRISENAEVKEIPTHVGIECEIDKSSILNPENKIQ
ncbi:hypothetical protein [Chryseobacterium sp.]|uniref:hypothetical protein n=1 Tax=Chryseobacterium sp. TaxID=1871047 RepID=UPI00321B15F8